MLLLYYKKYKIIRKKFLTMKILSLYTLFFKIYIIVYITSIILYIMNFFKFYYSIHINYIKFM
jgi:hypothetical protein